MHLADKPAALSTSALRTALTLSTALFALTGSAYFDRAGVYLGASTALLLTAVALLAGMQGRAVAMAALLAHTVLTLSASTNLEMLARSGLGVALVLGVAYLASSREQLRATASHDPLTGLLNRRGLAAVAAHRLADSSNEAAVAVFDLDRFKALNDRHGHAAGDRALCLLADVLRTSRRSDVAARLGGDEFALLITLGAGEDAALAAERLRRTFIARCNDEALDLDVSIGVAMVEDGDLDDALRAADRAMYADKHRSRSIERRVRKHVRVWPLAVAAIGAIALSPTLASAQHQRGGTSLHETPPPVPSTDVRVELLGGSLAPLATELTGRVVFLDRVFMSLSLGVGTYGDAAYVIATELGASAQGAQLAHDLASGLFSMRAELGVRPFEGEGLEIAVGYAMLTHDVRLRAGTVSDATGISTEGSFVATSFMLHAIHAEVGWTFRLLDHFLIRPAIGWLQVLDASAALDDLGTSYADQSLDALASDTVGIAETWGMTPTLSLSVGYSF